MTGRCLCMPYRRTGAEMLDKCPKCGSVEVDQTARSYQRALVDVALDQMRRHKHCIECGHEWDTLELAESEVVRLRGLAHRAVMGGV
jgi:transcriptional regulator NrdR family protein